MITAEGDFSFKSSLDAVQLISGFINSAFSFLGPLNRLNQSTPNCTATSTEALYISAGVVVIIFCTCVTERVADVLVAKALWI